jgi:hypothetical protein
LPSAKTARTRAKSAYGEPVIHGSVSAGDPTGVCRLVSSQRMLFSRNESLVASWSS